MSIAELEERFVDLVEGAALLHIHPMSLRRIVRTGELPVRRVGAKYLIDRADLERFKDTYDPRPWRRQGRKGRLL